MTDFNRSLTPFLPNQFAFIQYSVFALFGWNLTMGRAFGQQQAGRFAFFLVTYSKWNLRLDCPLCGPQSKN